MVLSHYINTLGQFLYARYQQRVHKIALDAGFTCPNRDGSKGRGGCSFCNNVSFSPHGRNPLPVATQIEQGRQVIRKRTGAKRYIAYFQAYTNTYADVQNLDQLYRQALKEPDIIGLSVGTRPDCVPESVLDLLAGYQAEGYEVWLELGLQSAFDETLARVNRGHSFADYQQAIQAAHSRQLQVCTHLILGLPGEQPWHYRRTLEQVLELGVTGLKIHPLHVVKGTQLANEWRRGQYQPLTLESYIEAVVDLIQHTPAEIIFHRVTGTAAPNLLLAPNWCSQKWRVINQITRALAQTMPPLHSYPPVHS